MAHRRRVDLLAAVEVADAGEEVAKRQRPPHGEHRQREGVGDLLGRAALADQPDEALPTRHLVGVEPRHVLDQRGLDGGGIVAGLEDRAGEEEGLGILAVGVGALGRDDFPGAEAPGACENAEPVFVAGPDDQGLEDAALAHARQDVGDVRRALGKAHVRLVDIELVERKEV